MLANWMRLRLLCWSCTLIATHARNWTVAVVVAPGFYLLDAMGPLDVFRAVELKAFEYVNLTSHEWRPGVPGGIATDSSIRAELLAPTTDPLAASDGVVVIPDGSVETSSPSSYDLVVVPAGADTPETRSFIKEVYSSGGAVLSVCTGAGLIASLGLLDGRDATSNSLVLWRMRARYPKVHWLSLRDRIDKRFIISQPPLRIVTTAGVTAGVDGALRFVSEWMGEPVAEAVREFIEWPLQLEEAASKLTASVAHTGEASAHLASKRLRGRRSVEGSSRRLREEERFPAAWAQTPYEMPSLYFPGPPRAALAAPGSCVLGSEWTPLALTERRAIAHDTLMLTFRLPDSLKELGLSTCACLLAGAPALQPVGAAGSAGATNATATKWTIRPYTPVSTNDWLVGHFQMMVKVYPNGVMSQYISKLYVGQTLDFKHLPSNVKLQYPFGADNIVMIAGGTGVAPFIQALNALLGTNTDTTKVTLLYSNKKVKDIIAQEILDDWAKRFADRFKLVHTLTRAAPRSNWKGQRGRINRSFLVKHLPPPNSNTLIFVCGPSSMYEALTGPRDDKALTGVLADLGFKAEQVVKF